MKSRMFVVDENSLETTKNLNIASLRVPIQKKKKSKVPIMPLKLAGKQWVKTVSDIMADLLQIEKGDYIFLWETKKGTQKSRIHGVYRAISSPYYDAKDKNDLAPFKIHIEKAYDFSNPIDEYDVLNNPHSKTSLWTIIGKKVANKSRGTSPLSPEESKQLILLLINKNPDYNFFPEDEKRFIKVKNPLHINYSNRGNVGKNISLSKLDPNKVNYFTPSGELRFEKTLEAIFNQEMTLRNVHFFKDALDIDPNKVIWYSNYLPYSIEQSEMDYVIFESDDGLSLTKITVIDFMKNRIDEDHIHRVFLYCNWLNETIALGGRKITRPLIICSKSDDFNSDKLKKNTQKLQDFCRKNEQQYGCRPLEIFEYSFENNKLKFHKKR